MIEITINMHGTTEPDRECTVTLALNGESNWERSHGASSGFYLPTDPPKWGYELTGDLTVTCPHGREQHISL